jgi:hypothetical protein
MMTIGLSNDDIHLQARAIEVASPELHACRCLVWFLGPSGPEGLRCRIMLAFVSITHSITVFPAAFITASRCFPGSYWRASLLEVPHVGINILHKEYYSLSSSSEKLSFVVRGRLNAGAKIPRVPFEVSPSLTW